MARLTEQNLEKYATEVVEGFFKQKCPLTDGVVKVAERENLNPEQIKRLVEAANNMTFQRQFSNAEGPDRTEASQFETADPNAAIQRLIHAAKDLMTSLDQSPQDLPPGHDLLAPLPITRPEHCPLNPAGPEDNFNESPAPKISGTMMIFKLRKTAEVLRDQAYQARVNFTDAFQKVASAFTSLYGPSFEAFEKDAFYHWGEDAVPFLKPLRASLKKPPVTYNHEAMTKVARLIDTQTPLMQSFSEMMRHYHAIDQIEKGQSKTAAYLKDLTA